VGKIKSEAEGYARNAARRAARGRHTASGTARPTISMEIQRQLEYSACSAISAVNDQLISSKTHLISTTGVLSTTSIGFTRSRFGGSTAITVAL
jgi:hypothetical protein